jgi:hypothetical protein
MNHLTDPELVDALDGQAPTNVVVHVRECGTCRDRLSDLAETLAETRLADMPEPSPLFWDHLSARIREDIARHPMPSRARWLAWPMWAPLGGLALVVVAIIAGLLREGPVSDPPAMTTVDDVRLQEDAALEAAWALTADLIGSGDAAAAIDAEGIVRPGSAELAAADLSPDEQVELLRLLRLELKVGG